MPDKGLARICCDIPRVLKKLLTIRAAENETSQAKIVAEALKQYLIVSC